MTKIKIVGEWAHERVKYLWGVTKTKTLKNEDPVKQKTVEIRSSTHIKHQQGLE